jgi:signal transduction histidine kinase
LPSSNKSSLVLQQISGSTIYRHDGEIPMRIAQGKTEFPDIARAPSEAPPGCPDRGQAEAFSDAVSLSTAQPLWQQLAQLMATRANSDVLAAMATAIGAEFAASCVLSGCHPHFDPIVWVAPTANWTDAEILAHTFPLAEIAIAQGEVITRSTLDEAPGAVAVLQLLQQGQVQGTLALLRQPTWTEPEVGQIVAVSPLVASTIAQITAHQQVHKHTQSQALMRQLTLAIRNATDLPQILPLAISGIASALQVDQGLVLRLKYWDPRPMRSLDQIPKARVLVESEWHRPQGDRVVELHPPAPALSNSFWVADCALCSQMFTTAAAPLALTDHTDFPTLLATTKLAPIFHPQTMPAVLLVPLESKHRILGFLVLQQYHPRHWQPAEIALAELVAAQLAAAIIQTETLRQVESLVEERTAQLQQSLELQAKLYDITRKQIEKLRQMNQRADEFLSTLSHELRTPLTSMMLTIRMLREAELTPDRRQRYLNILEQQCTQETNLINDLLALQELETNQVSMQWEMVDLQQILADRIQSFEHQWAAKGLQLTVSAPSQPIWFKTDRASLNRILLELFTNAGKYADPHTPVRLTVIQSAEGGFILTVVNQGAGIPPTELPHIFEKFRRCQGVTQKAIPGTGLGLALVKSLIQHLKGTITATSEPIADLPSAETCFTVTLPPIVEADQP